MPYLSITMVEAVKQIAAAVAGGDQQKATTILVDYTAEDAIRAESDRGRVPRWAWQCLRRGDGRMAADVMAVWSSNRVFQSTPVV